MRRTSVPFGIAVGVAISACFTKPDPPNVIDPVDPDAGVTSDGIVSVDTLLPVCPVRDNFTSGSTCGSWGNEEGSGMRVLTRNQGELLMYTSGSNGGSAACQGTSFVPFSSVVVQITAIVNSMGAKTGVQLNFDDGSRFAVEIASAGSGAATLTTITNNNSPDSHGSYSASTMQYFRMRREGTSSLELSYGADGSTWPQMQMYTFSTPIAQAKIRLYTIFGTSVTNFVNASFDNLDMCAP